MWTETTRRQYRREDLRYASDMTDAEWALIEPHMPTQKVLGRPRKVQLRGVVEALLYILRTACPWRLLPRDFPKRSSVQHYFYAWQKQGLWEQVNFFLLQIAREREGREASPSAGVIDSQSVKTTESGVREVTTRAKRSRAASAISSLTPVGIWLAPRCTPPTSRIATGRRGYWRRSAISSPGCVTSLPTALTPARSWKPLLPGSGSGRLRSSSDRTRRQVLRYCHGAGWSSEPSAGLVATGGWRRISKRPLPAAKRGFIWLRFSCWHAGSRGRPQLIDLSPSKAQLLRFLARHLAPPGIRRAWTVDNQEARSGHRDERAIPGRPGIRLNREEFGVVGWTDPRRRRREPDVVHRCRGTGRPILPGPPIGL